MRGIRSVVVLSVFALVGSTWAVAQQAVPPPPRPADSGPTLEATLTFIQQKINGVGKLNFANYVHDNSNGSDWIVRKTFEISNFRANAATCRIDFHSTVANNGQVTGDGDYWFSLRDAEDVVILPVEQAWKEIDSKDGNTTWSYKSDPAVSVLRVRRKGGIANEFDFTDQEMADRVAKAVTHAIELCGGGSKDPF